MNLGLIRFLKSVSLMILGLITFLITFLEPVSGIIPGLIIFLIRFLEAVSGMILNLKTFLPTFLARASVRDDPGSHYIPHYITGGSVSIIMLITSLPSANQVMDNIFLLIKNRRKE